MDREKSAKKRALMIIGLIGLVAFIGVMVWSVFINRPAEVTGGVEEQDGPGEEVEYDTILYKNLELLEEEIDEDLVATIRAELDLALINNSELNTKQSKSYEATFSAPVQLSSMGNTSVLFYQFELTIYGTKNGDVNYDVYAFIDGDTDPGIEASYYTSLVLKAKKNGFSDLTVSNSSDKDEVKRWASQYIKGDIEVIESEIY